MKLEMNLEWALKKLRLIFLIVIFYVLYVYVQPVFAFLWICYFILNDLSEAIDELESMKEHRRQTWDSLKPSRRKGF